MVWTTAYLSEQRLKPSEAHDDGLDQREVGVGLQRLDEDPQQLFHLRITHHLTDAAEHDNGSRLRRRVVLKRKAARQVCPVLAPLTVHHLFHTTLNNNVTQYE